MSMSRKDYEMLAGVIGQNVSAAKTIRYVEDRIPGGDRRVSETQATSLQGLAYNMAQHLTADNSRFDHVRFYEAAGFTVVGNYPLVFPEDH